MSDELAPNINDRFEQFEAMADRLQWDYVTRTRAYHAWLTAIELERGIRSEFTEGLTDETRTAENS